MKKIKYLLCILSAVFMLYLLTFINNHITKKYYKPKQVITVVDMIMYLNSGERNESKH